MRSDQAQRSSLLPIPAYAGSFTAHVTQTICQLVQACFIVDSCLLPARFARKPVEILVVVVPITLAEHGEALLQRRLH